MISTLLSCSAISGVNVSQVFPSNICEVIDRTDRRGRKIAHMVPREEAGNVEWDLRIDLSNPQRFIFHVFGRVILAWYDKSGRFDVGV